MPVETGIFYSSIFGSLKCDFDVITAKRIVIFELDIMRVKMPAITRVFVVFNNYFTIEIVHTTSYGRSMLRPYISSKQFFYFIDPIHKQVHFVFCIIQIERSAARGGDAKLFM